MSNIALVVYGSELREESIAIPSPAPHQVLVRISHVAQNPTDKLAASVSLYTIQLAALYGLEVITTCSHADLVRSYGAMHVFDYNDAGVADKIQAAGPLLQYAFDTIGSERSSVRSRKGGNICTVRPG
ncbi:uncharacterized protein BP01DRAFT_408588 [Aspergillus saccharolyticus JOP 1030-1]|uniref:Alcohol dehydrogenase-like C-terminal domain-containing protein n=1 Tax=Aspergillus saccharolyticus JOP 1030-1 TaxID=1450539 RepID=A0A319A079_9EURO|nr:hypothetical protein BP01DRAFT_408588 [Aspergillus saccharolyticus JOP 1030-1]PYH41032.1 hypothetical protein BP01DRAFT_408588 [Aspergillus saccharolyticus JOP 1030-1]